MEVDQIRLEAVFGQACGRAIGRLTHQHRPFERLQVMVSCRRRLPGRAHPQPAYAGDLALARGVDEDDLVARIGRKRARQVGEMPWKVAVREKNPHGSGCSGSQSGGHRRLGGA
jgi:hypothetical protein